MIELALEPYCQNCMYLKPVVMTASHRNSVTGENMVTTVIKCREYEKCAAIAKIIDKYYSNLH